MRERMPYFHHFNESTTTSSSSASSSSSSAMNNKCCSSSTTSAAAAFSAATSSSQGNNNGNVIKTVKTGYLMHFKKRLFGKAWREEFVVLYEDSSLIWFRDRDRNEPEGGIFLKDAPEMLAAGQWTSRVPAHPEFPNGCTFHHSIAIGSRHRRDKVHWFLCKSDSELIDWMSAISHTLPPVPPPPEELRNSRRNLAKLDQASLTPPPRQPTSSSSASSLVDKRLALLKHQPSSPDVLLGKMGRINLVDEPNAKHHAPRLSEKSRSSSTGKMNYLDHTKPRVTFREDVMAGVMMAGALSQWNTATAASGFLSQGFFGAAGGAPVGTSASVPWDWGMGWGWAGWSPEGSIGASGVSAFCGSCALEQHHAAMAASSSTSYNNIPYNGRHEFYYDDDHELGELGDTADVGCDFGGDFGGF